MRRVRPYVASASLFILRFRPVSSSARSDSAGHRNDTCFIPSGILRSSPSFRAASDGRSDRLPLQSCILFRDCSRVRRRETPFATASLRVLVPSTVPVRTACLRAATPWAPAPAGFGHPLDALISDTGLPGVSHPGPFMGFLPFRASPFVRIAFVSRRTQSLLPFGTPGTSTMRAATPGAPHESRHPVRIVTSAPGRCPLGVFASPGFSTRPVSPLSRTPPRAFHTQGSGPRIAAPRGNPTGRPFPAPNQEVEPGPHEVRSPRRRSVGSGSIAASLCVHWERRDASPRLHRSVRPRTSP